ncbi:MAG: hypothetical protein J6C82_02885 [Clostridia bacterium]|nr:hypothetical protein [Clostridia bacterium]
MAEKCSSCSKTESGYYCELGGKSITDEMHEKFCSSCNTDECPIYQYYLGEYNKIVSRIKNRL